MPTLHEQGRSGPMSCLALSIGLLTETSFALGQTPSPTLVAQVTGTVRFGCAAVKVRCTNPPPFTILKGALTNVSGTLLGSETSIGPVDGSIAGIGPSFHLFEPRKRVLTRKERNAC